MAKKTTNKKASEPEPANVPITASADVEDPATSALVIVGIGSSAGGLKALKEFFRELPADPQAAFVVVPHLSPDHKSMLGEILANETDLVVETVTRNVRARANSVYIIPADRDLSIKNGVLRPIKRDETQRHLPIDRFFSDLATDQGNNAVGIILSGLGADGAGGARHIRAAGGLVFAQEPATAEYDGMPGAAIATDCVDFVLPPDRMPAELVRVLSHPYVRGDIFATREQDAADEYDRIVQILRAATKADFSGYKMSTVIRRIAKRMAVRQLEHPHAYAELLQTDPAECEQLRREMLIHVTEFFRDRAAFDALENTVFPQLLERAGNDDPIRIWVPGCATGEEAYSIGCALLDTLERRGVRREIKLFATDLSESSIERARAGLYLQTAAAAIDPHRLERYFEATPDTVKVGQRLREMCVFARQDMISDPPFSNIDLISCRNVLIYFNREMQRRAVERFHYALRPGGYLFLGISETLSQSTDLFELLDRKHKIYASREIKQRIRYEPESKRAEPRDIPAARRTTPMNAGGFDLRAESERLMLARYGPAGFLLDPQLKILDFRGDVRDLLSPMPGEATFDAVKMIAPELITDLDSAAQEARATAAPVERPGIEITRDGVVRSYDLDLVPIVAPDETIAGYLALFSDASRFERPAVSVRSEPEAAGEIDRLKATLARNQEHVRSVILEHEAYAEELKAANEEILSSNEELQSTNEELETAKEELQAANEELSTVNEELEVRNRELDELASDMSSLLIGVEIPIVLVDRDLRIRRFTPPAAELFNLIPGDIGRPIGNLQSRIDLPDLVELVSRVMTDSLSHDLEVQDESGHWYSLRLRPYKPVKNRIEGALIALVDIDVNKRGAAAIVETIRESLLVLDQDSRIESVNPMFCKTFAVERDAVEGEDVFTILDGALDTPAWRELLERRLRDEIAIDNTVIETDLGPAGTKFLAVSGCQIINRGVGQTTRLVVISDETRAKSIESKLRQEHQLNTKLYDQLRTIVLVLDGAGRIVGYNPFMAELTGRPLLETRGKDWFETFIPADDQPASRHAFDATLEGTRIDGTVTSIITADGIARPIEWFATRLFDEQGELTGILSVGYDISERNARESRLLETEQQLRALTQRLVENQEARFRHLARELHDDFTQRLAAVSMNLGSIRDSLGSESASARAALDTLAEQTNEIAEALHDASRRLHPSVLEDLGLEAALRGEAQSMRSALGIPVTFKSSNLPEKLAPPVALCLYRVTQECLRNIQSHADASAVHINIDVSDDVITLEIRDIGDGFDLAEASAAGGIGLISMDERVRAHGGVFEIESQPRVGTNIRVTVPLKR